MENIRKYIENKIEYCKEKQKDYPVNKYSKDNKMTDEQMTGYYQGMGEWLYAVIYQMQDAVLPQANVIKSVCDVCGSDDIIEAPHMGKNCNRCHPL